MSDFLDERANQDSSVCVYSAAEITRLRAELATARKDALEEAARRLEELHKNHKYKPETGEGSEHDTGYYRALAEGVAHILALAKGEGQ